MENIIISIVSFYLNIGQAVFNFYVTYSRLILDYMHFIFNSAFYVVLSVTVILTFMYLLMGIVLMFRKTKQREKPAPKSKLPFVTIQIPTFNELAALNCAKKCLNLDYPKNKFEILIGDDSSDKLVSKEINTFAKKHVRVKVTRRGSNIGFKPGNLNHMLKFTKGQYIVIFDSDFLPEKDFLKRIIAPFVHDESVSTVQARWITKNFSQNLVSIIGGTIPLLTHYLGMPFLNLIKGNTFIAGSAEAIKKSDLIEQGGWTSGSLTEDIEYSLRLTKAGKKMIYLENLHCECEAPFTIKDLGKQQKRWAYGVVSAIKKHFFNIIKNNRISFNNKFNMFLLLSGYVVTFLFFLLGVLGMLSIITHRPEAINWTKLVSETTLNILLTSGFLATMLIVLMLGNKAKESFKLILASFTVGMFVIFLVTEGIFKAILDRPMHWFMLTKKGNEFSI